MITKINELRELQSQKLVLEKNLSDLQLKTISTDQHEAKMKEKDQELHAKALELGRLNNDFKGIESTRLLERDHLDTVKQQLEEEKQVVLKLRTEIKTFDNQISLIQMNMNNFS